MAKILLVEDDLHLSKVIKDWLTSERYVVEHTETAAEAAAFLHSFDYDMLILDWGLPDGSGIDLCRNFRAAGGSSPILMLTGRKLVEEKEAGLDAGADDYLVKPFHVKELSARVRALLRRPRDITSKVLKAGKVELDAIAFKVTFEGKEIRLLPKEFDLLEFMMRYHDQVFSVEALLKRVWPAEESSSPEAVRQCMKRLRDRLAEAGAKDVIRTIHGAGYKLESKE